MMVTGMGRMTSTSWVTRMMRISFITWITRIVKTRLATCRVTGMTVMAGLMVTGMTRMSSLGRIGRLEWFKNIHSFDWVIRVKADLIL